MNVKHAEIVRGVIIVRCVVTAISAMIVSIAACVMEMIIVTIA